MRKLDEGRAREREMQKEQVSGVIGSFFFFFFLNKQAQKSGSVLITAYERGLCMSLK